MPPINNTNCVEAKDYFYTSLSHPLCEKGYYVISPILAMDVFKQESAYDSEMFIDGNLDSFGNFFGADAVLFTIIKGWDKSTFGNTIKVEIEYLIKSTKTNEILFDRNCKLTVDCSITGSGYALLDLAISAVSTALTDKVIAARKCNYFVLADLPEGRYGLNYLKDNIEKVSDKDISATIKR